MATVKDIVRRLKGMANPANVAGMARYGIGTKGTLGIPMPALRAMAREIGRDHRLAGGLWKTGLHEARILAALVDEPGLVSGAQMDAWAEDFDSWDVCDQVCSNLFDKTSLAHRKALAWSRREAPFAKRAGFVLMAALAVHDRSSPDAAFEAFLPAILRECKDERNYVRKAVNWALRQIGKRSPALHLQAVNTARALARTGDSTARWIAADALRELRNGATIRRLRARHTKAARR